MAKFKYFGTTQIKISFT